MSIDASTLIILGFGALLIIGGALIVRIYTSRVNRCSIKLIGVIKDVDYEEGYDSADRKEYRYFPVVGYYFEGTYYQTKSDAVCSYNENEYVEGAEIAIRVNPENPKDFIVAQGSKFIFPGLILVLIGFIIECVVILTKF